MKKTMCVILTAVVSLSSFVSCTELETTDSAVPIDNISFGNGASISRESLDSTETSNVRPESSVVGQLKRCVLTPINSTGTISFSNVRNTFNGFDTKNDVVLSSEFSVKSDSAFPFVYGKMGYCDEKGNVLVDSKFSFTSHFIGGKAFVTQSVYKEYSSNTIDHYIHSIIDKNGNVLYSFQSKPLTDTEVDYLDYNGQSDKSVFFIRGNKLCQLKIEGNSYQLVEGYELTSSRGVKKAVNVQGFTGLFTASHGYTLRAFDGKQMYNINSDSVKVSKAFGKFFDSTAYNDASRGVFFFDNGYANVMNSDGKWGLMKLSSGEMVIDYLYDYVGSCRENVIPVSKYGKWGAVDMANNEIIPFQFMYIGPFTNGRAFALDSNNVGCVINTSGEILAVYKDKVPCVGCYVSPFTKTGIAVAYYKGGFSIIDNAGNKLLSLTDHDDLTYFSEDYIVAKGKLYKVEIK